MIPPGKVFHQTEFTACSKIAKVIYGLGQQMGLQNLTIPTGYSFAWIPSRAIEWVSLE